MSGTKVEHQSAFLLQAHPWRETSLVVDVFSRDAGRLSMVAKGARRPQSQLRGVLMAFQPLLVSWSGRGEVKTLTSAEWTGGQPLLAGAALMCGYYVNELLARLLPREDPHPALFDRYCDLLKGLSRGQPQDLLLRRFELALLRELGYAPTLDHDVAGEPVDPAADYVFIIEQGPSRATPQAGDLPHIGGQALLDLAQERLDAPETLAQAKGLMRRLIQHLIGAHALESRRIFMELQEL
ncbi:DNA repair protein RecO [Niveibacterium sp. SC-1]|uniref:DNA repair protein RecO n=1 Tax=Niveibacterium sp. SC-1 TaxID=3135646 RepID=UPI00312003EA